MTVIKTLKSWLIGESWIYPEPEPSPIPPHNWEYRGYLPEDVFSVQWSNGEETRVGFDNWDYVLLPPYKCTRCGKRDYSNSAVTRVNECYGKPEEPKE